MNLVKRFKPWSRYGPCWCLTVFRWGRRKVELCYAPGWFEPPEHVHPNSDGEFLILWARNRFIYRKTKPITAYDLFKGMSHVCGQDMPGRWDLKDWISAKSDCVRLESGPGDTYTANVPPWKFKTLSVRAGVPHAFKKSTSCMIWICFETWKEGVPVTSVAEDFVPV